ncbi:MAG: hypothetical protein ACO4AK_02865, partial [Candidatus Nanopelagicales bacterium]
MRGTRPAVIAIIALLLAGCGVRLDSAPQSIPAGAIPSAAASATGAPSPSANPARAVRVWFAREDGLVPVLTDLRREPAVPPADIVAALAAGPSPEQAEDGLRT